MPIADSSLYLACNSVADFIRSGLQTNANGMTVYLGSPVDLMDKKDENRINLFFYRFEQSGFQANAHPQDPWRMRVYCMISCLAEEANSDPGENDLRMLGLVLSLFHEQRILPEITIGEESIRLLAVFNPSTDEQINQLWSIQGEASYRPSVIYEIALAPIMPETIRGEPPKVASIGLESFPDIDKRYQGFSKSALASLVTSQPVNELNPAWLPVIGWVDNEQCISGLELDVEVTSPATFTPEIWVAGAIGETITFEWNVWQGDDWQTEAGSDLVVSSNQIDQHNIPISLPTISLPALVIDGEHDRWQLILVATRSYQPSPDSGVIQLRSNPILISLYRGSLL